MRSRVRPILDGQHAVALELVVPIGFKNVQIVESVALQFAKDDFLKIRFDVYRVKRDTESRLRLRRLCL